MQGPIVAVVVPGLGKEPTGFCWMTVDGEDVYASAQELPPDIRPSAMREFLDSVRSHRPGAPLIVGVEKPAVPDDRTGWQDALGAARRGGQWDAAAAAAGAQETLLIAHDAWREVVRMSLQQHRQSMPKGERAWLSAATWTARTVLGHDTKGATVARAAILAAGLLEMAGRKGEESSRKGAAVAQHDGPVAQQAQH